MQSHKQTKEHRIEVRMEFEAEKTDLNFHVYITILRVFALQMNHLENLINTFSNMLNNAIC